MPNIAVLQYCNGDEDGTIIMSLHFPDMILLWRMYVVQEHKYNYYTLHHVQYY